MFFRGLLAHIFESKIEPVANMVADWSGDRYPARRSDALQARCDVDPVAKNILSLHNDVAHVHSHAKFDALILRRTDISFSDATLQLGGARHCVHDTGELYQHSVTGQFDDSSLMLADFGINEIGPQRVECCERARFVRSHEPAVTDDVGGKNSSQAALHVGESKPENRTHRDRKSFRQMRDEEAGQRSKEPARRSLNIFSQFISVVS